jgi:hypothetical protein
MTEFENAVKLAADYGLGVVLSIFMAFALIVLGKKLIAGYQSHATQLVSIIKEKEEGLIDHVSELSVGISGLAARIQQMSEQIDYMHGRMNIIKDSQDEILDSFDR